MPNIKYSKVVLIVWNEEVEIVREGYFSDDGTEVDPASVPIPPLCISCSKNNDAKEEIPCILNRMDQMEEIQNREMFCCFAYEPINSSVNKEQILNEMKGYLAKKNRQSRQRIKR